VLWKQRTQGSKRIIHPTCRHNAAGASGRCAAHRRGPGAEARRTEAWRGGIYGRETEKKYATQAAKNVPEVEHLDISHPPEYADEKPCMFDPRPDEGELAEARQALERARVLDEVVVQVQHSNVWNQTRQAGRERRQPACGQLEVDEMVARLRNETVLEWVACAKARDEVRHGPR